jgi:transposase InsO family protein
LKGIWVSPEIRDNIVTKIHELNDKTDLSIRQMLKVIKLSSSKFYEWQTRFGAPNQHNGHIPRDFWLEPWETAAITKFKHDHPFEGYKRLTYMMMDQDIVAVSPSTTYRILKREGLTSRWNNKPLDTEKKGFTQPLGPHQHWHVDISYVNFLGTYLFLISVLDGYSRYIVHHDLRTHMQEYDVEVVLQRAKEKYPEQSPTVISDNGSQFIANDFKSFIRFSGLKHIKTSVNHPQSNGKIEAFHKNIKVECIRRQSFLNLTEAREKIAEYVYEYNHHRLHSGIKYIAPFDMLSGRAPEIFKERDRKLQQARQRRRENNKLRQRTIFEFQ